MVQFLFFLLKGSLTAKNMALSSELLKYTSTVVCVTRKLYFLWGSLTRKQYFFVGWSDWEAGQL